MCCKLETLTNDYLHRPGFKCSRWLIARCTTCIQCLSAFVDNIGPAHVVCECVAIWPPAHHVCSLQLSLSKMCMKFCTNGYSCVVSWGPMMCWSSPATSEYCAPRGLTCSSCRTYMSPSISVEKFFHEDGFVARPAFHKWVRQQLKEFAAASTEPSAKKNK